MSSKSICCICVCSNEFSEKIRADDKTNRIKDSILVIFL